MSRFSSKSNTRVENARSEYHAACKILVPTVTLIELTTSVFETVVYKVRQMQNATRKEEYRP